MHIGLPEILLIVFVALLLFGAKRIPELARAFGRASHEYKKAKEAIANEGKDLMAEAEKAAGASPEAPAGKTGSDGPVV
ncbi:MAG: twin-arginine translocase TatA/TatE family subunit [Kiritimatiellae bacterium]|nr:twin-arginine translocase TatA/TatE family subunit [Kiritimatiellia bacterium]